MKGHGRQDPGAVFARIQSRFDESEPARHGLICAQGFYTRCFVLKLQKASDE